MNPANEKGSKARTLRPRRATKRNRRFLDSEIWCNSDSTIKSLSSPTSTSPIASSTPLVSSPTNGTTDHEDGSLQSNLTIKSTPLGCTRTQPNTETPSSSPPPLPPAKSPTLGCTQAKMKTNLKRNGVQSKNFIRFRFQIDCGLAVDVNVDELVNFLKSNLKIEGKKNNLAGLVIERRNSNIHILSKVMLKKKYLKLMSKKYLRKMKQFKYRVIEKNKRAYQIILKVEKKL